MAGAARPRIRIDPQARGERKDGRPWPSSGMCPAPTGHFRSWPGLAASDGSLSLRARASDGAQGDPLACSMILMCFSVLG